MKTSILLLSLFALPAFAQEPSVSPTAPSIPSDSPRALTSPSMSLAASPTPLGQATASTATAGQPNDAEMMKQMMDLAKLNENHKLLSDLDGTWNYTVTFWPAPGAPPMKSTGSAVRKSVMGGRYCMMDVSGKMKMPGADGKLQDFDFKGHGMEGYDNAKKKFVGTWIDNMSTGILLSEGDYDAASKTFTYSSEMEPLPGMKTKVREVVKVTDKNHMNLEWYEDRGGQEVKTMEIAYTRKK